MTAGITRICISIICHSFASLTKNLINKFSHTKAKMTQKHGVFHSTNAQLQVTTGRVVSRRKVCCNWLEIKRGHFQIMTSHTRGKEEKYTNLVHYFNSIPSIFMKCHLLWWLPHTPLLMRNNLEQVLGVTTIPPSTYPRGKTGHLFCAAAHSELLLSPELFTEQGTYFW